jgi:hypothetical protein
MNFYENNKSKPMLFVMNALSDLEFIYVFKNKEAVFNILEILNKIITMVPYVKE